MVQELPHHVHLVEGAPSSMFVDFVRGGHPLLLVGGVFNLTSNVKSVVGWDTWLKDVITASIATMVVRHW